MDFKHLKPRAAEQKNKLSYHSIHITMATPLHYTKLPLASDTTPELVKKTKHPNSTTEHPGRGASPPT